MPLKATATKIRKISASMSTAPGVGTSVNVKSPPGVWGRLEVGVGLKIDKFITCIAIAVYKMLDW